MDLKEKHFFWILSLQFLVVSGSAWSWIICINLGNYKLLQRTSDSCLLHHTPHCFLPGYDDGNRINRCPPTLTTGVYSKFTEGTHLRKQMCQIYETFLKIHHNLLHFMISPILCDFFISESAHPMI